jgi:RNA polymerase sigma-70 factor (ECF subfamily)
MGGVTEQTWPADDPVAAGEYLASLAPGLLRFAHGLTHDFHAAEDLVAEGVTRAFERRSELADVMDMRAWLRRVIHNLAVDRFRRDREFVVEDVEERWMSDEYTVDTAAVVAAAETREEIDDALLRIPVIYRTTVMLHDIEGYTVRDIAESSEIDLPAAKQRLRRGRMMLVSALADGHERRVAMRGVPLRCWDARSRVSDYLDGDVDADTAAMLQRHLASCPTCPPLVAALVGVKDRLGDLRDPDTVMDPELTARIRLALR